MDLSRIIDVALPDFDQVVKGQAGPTASADFLLKGRRSSPVKGVLSAFSACCADSSGFPYAAYEAYEEWGREDGYWFRADPVQFMPSKSRLMMVSPRDLAITVTHAQKLIDALNRHFGEDGFEFHMASPNRWYLRMESEVLLNTRPWWCIKGQDVLACMPEGEWAKRWQGFSNEIQMLFHPIHNPPAEPNPYPAMVNGVWIWGNGRRPSQNNSLWSKVYSDVAAVKGYAAVQGIKLASLSEGVDGLIGAAQNGRVLLAFENPQDLSENPDGNWYQDLTQTERQWIRPLLDALRAERLREIHWHTGSLSIRMETKDLRSGLKTWIAKIFRT
ncbi:MAG: hypothetical protein OEX00_03490 [Gammaproteobacteria bacterium]|nr:hypothetical protein [Gammaproteobacteria bacterium]MDH5694445.1 hypothetical protein [Gammaproteobacteria bacterium]